MPRTKGATVTTRPNYEGNTRCWVAMRVLSTFTIPQLCMTAGVKRDNAYQYISCLARAGFVRKTHANQNGKAGSFAVWRLIKNPGPKAPIPCEKRKGLYDPNTKKKYGGSSEQVA